MSSASLRTTPWFALVAASLIVSTSAGSVRAQVAGGDLSTSAPALRGTVPDPIGEATDEAPTSGGETSGGNAPPVSTGPDAATPPPPNKFALPKTKSKARTLDRVKIPRNGPPLLPPLQPYPTALRLRAGVPIADTNAAPAPTPSTAALPVTIRLKPKLVEDSYAPLGIQAGTLLVTPYITQSLGYDSNPDQASSNVKGSGFSRTEGGLGLVSQWSSNELRADLRGGYNDYFSDSGANRPDATGTIDFKLDIDRDTAIDAEQRFSIDTQRPGSPDVSANTVSRPLITTFGETLGGTETFGRASIGLHGSFDRVAYDNAVLSSGAIQDLANGNYNDYGVRLRGTYEVTPVLKPFVDVLIDDRLHDATVDLSGYRRDSVGVIGQIGTSFEFDHLFSGSLSAGYGNRSYDDPRLRALEGPVVNGSISYAVTPLTTINLLASTTFDETTVPGSSGAQSRSVTLSATHQLLRSLSLTGSIAYLDSTYTGIAITENTLSETLKAEYHLSRLMVATAAYTHQDLHSTVADSSYSQDVILFGLRLQR